MISACSMTFMDTSLLYECSCNMTTPTFTLRKKLVYQYWTCESCFCEYIFHRKIYRASSLLSGPYSCTFYIYDYICPYESLYDTGHDFYNKKCSPKKQKNSFFRCIFTLIIFLCTPFFLALLVLLLGLSQ